ncbi:hypothetical protein CPT03_14390 [Pedobacter ginsengisoli]|uniref:UspA domain-containing protein n=1 Tax=Pedobacter ginsengisoli TaxID=363852 RepID=A0A2D1U7J5_9SPHI|nr:hypothetical protein [Pedobacter ginsengisoli]ATP57576.1 hypothetical protein CPT03_14390 [Pedobacter ginsengisoli]
MQTILISTDFNCNSVNCIPSLCKQLPEQELNFIFIHMFKLSDRMGDLLMLSRRNKEYKYVSQQFYDQCELMKQTYPQIKAIKIEFFYGSTVGMFRNYLENAGVTQILAPAHCSTDKLNNSSIDPALLIQRSGTPVMHINENQPVKELPKRKIILEPETLLAEA